MTLLQTVSAYWWSWMAAMAVQAALLAAAVMLIDKLLGRWMWPRMRAALWGAVLIRLLISPTIASPVGLYELGAARTDHAVATTASSSGVIVAGFAVWAAGAGVLGVMLLQRYRSVRRHWLSGSRCLDVMTQLVVNRCATRIGLRRTPVVVASSKACGPAVVGVVRPVVVLPEPLLDAASRTSLEHVLAHEFAHLRRRDPLICLICRLVQIAYWYHPAAWLMARRLDSIREVCSDAAALVALEGEPETYRRTLLDMARSLIEPDAAASLGFLPRRSQLIQRLEALRRPIEDRAWLRRALSIATVVLLFVGLAPKSTVISTSFPCIVPGEIDTAGCLRLRYTVQAMLAAEQQGG